MRVSLVILTLNEIVGLQALWDSIPLNSVDEVFAVDGGSTDGTVQFLESKGIPVLHQKVKGRGEAFRMAFEASDCDSIIFFSPDGNEDPLDIPKFRPHLQAGADLVIGTRMVPGARNEEDDQVIKLRKWANNAFTWIANAVWNRGPYLTDTINGYRAITKHAWSRLNPDGPGYTIEYQSSIRAMKLKLKVIEFKTQEGNRIDGREGSPSLPTGIAFLKIFFSELRRGKSWPLTQIHRPTDQ